MSQTTVYVRAARHTTSSPTDHRVHVTGSVLHVGVGVYLPPGTGLLPIFTWVPLCGGRRSPHVELWRITGPWSDGWLGVDDAGEITGRGHSHWPMCADCQRVHDELAAAIVEQIDREQTAHTRVAQA